MVSNQKLKWKSDFDKGVLIQNFEKRGWQKATGEGKLIHGLLYATFSHDFVVSQSRWLEHLLGQPLDSQTDFQSRDRPPSWWNSVSQFHSLLFDVSNDN